MINAQRKTTRHLNKRLAENSICLMKCIITMFKVQSYRNNIIALCDNIGLTSVSFLLLKSMHPQTHFSIPTGPKCGTPRRDFSHTLFNSRRLGWLTRHQCYIHVLSAWSQVSMSHFIHTIGAVCASSIMSPDDVLCF